MSFPPPTAKQARVLWFSVTALSIAVLLVLTGLVFWGLGWLLNRLSAVLMPMAIALVLAYILDPVVEFLVRKKVPRLWAIATVFFVSALLVLGLLGSVVPGMIREARRLIDDLPKNAQRLHEKVEILRGRSSRLGIALPDLWRSRPSASPKSTDEVQTSARTNTLAPTNQIEVPPAQTNAVELSLNIKVKDHSDGTAAKTNGVAIVADTETLKKALDAPFSETIMPGLAKALVFIAKWVTAQLGQVATWIEFIIGFVLVPVYLFYFLLEKKGITRRWTDYLPIQESKVKDEIIFILMAINDCLIVFFRGQVLVALCVGTLLAVGYLIMGLNYAVLLGVVAGVLGIVPYLGTIISLLLALTVATIQFGDWKHPLLVLAIAAVVKLLEDFVIAPKIIGNRSGMHPLTIIVAVLVGTTLLGGIIGAVLAVPLTAVLRTLMFRYVWKKRGM